MEPIRILQALTIMNQGGAETMIMNYYRALDKTKYQFDFLVNRQERGFYDDEIEAMGGHIYRAFPVRPWTYIQYFRWLDKFFAEHHDYKAVHCHIQDNAGFVHKYAKKYGIEKRVTNSHIADIGFDYKYIFRVFGRYYVHKYSTVNVSCGVDAGKFLFGDRPFELLNNAIDTKKFTFNPAIRDKVRKELNISDRIVVGDVARFGYQKNHKYLVDVFAELHKVEPKAYLLLVGDGDLKEKVQKQIEDLGLQNDAKILSKRPDVNELLQAFDVFFMPSLFEGLPVSVIEAQAAGLHSVLADTIDRRTDITGNIQFVSLNASKKEWINALLNAAKQPREDTSEAIIKAAYDVNGNLKRLLTIYNS